MAIKKYTKVGLFIFVPSLLLWLWADNITSESTIKPLTIPLPTKNGEVTEKTLRLEASGGYSFKALFDANGSLKIKELITCDYTMILLRNGDVVKEDHIKCIKANFISFQENGKERLGSNLSFCRLKSGEYTLRLSNQSDLTYLDSTNPTLEIIGGHVSHETALFRDIGKILFLLTGIVGLFFLGAGFLADNEKVQQGSD